MLKGSCLCGGVKYEIDGGLGAVTNCHCSLCRKMSGSAFQWLDDSNGIIPLGLRRRAPQGMGIVAGISSGILRAVWLAHHQA